MTGRSAISPLRRIVFRWEGILFAILVAICVFNAFASPYFLNLYNLFESTQSFSEKAILALSLALIIIVRDIDLSVPSIIALVSAVIGWLALQGFGAPTLLLVMREDLATLDWMSPATRQQATKKLVRFS